MATLKLFCEGCFILGICGMKVLPRFGAARHLVLFVNARRVRRPCWRFRERGEICCFWDWCRGAKASRNRVVDAIDRRRRRPPGGYALGLWYRLDFLELLDGTAQHRCERRRVGGEVWLGEFVWSVLVIPYSISPELHHFVYLDYFICRQPQSSLLCRLESASSALVNRPAIPVVFSQDLLLRVGHVLVAGPLRMHREQSALLG